MNKFIVACLVALFCATPSLSQTWTSGSGKTPVWVPFGAIGDGVNRFPEVSTAEQGGDPPAWQYEPAPIDENGKYTRSTWLNIVPAGTCIETAPNDNPSKVGTDNGCRPYHGEDKFRLICSYSHMNRSDPILAPGNPLGPHHHTFFGNGGTNENSTYASLRNNPKSSCSGGPLTSSAYWEPTMMYEIKPGVYVPVIPDGIAFYYNTSGAVSPTLTRLPRGMAFIGGVDPGNRFNTVRQQELKNAPNQGTGGWDTRDTDQASGVYTERHNGWAGWSCVRLGNGAQPVMTTGPQNDFGRQFVNNDGSDPWNGTCEGPNLQLIATLNAPDCWDGYNITSPNGRDHFRYSARQGDNSWAGCPTGWWRVPTLVAKPEFPAFTHAKRQKMFLSSDRMSTDTTKWNPPGSTMHFDWMNGWDSQTIESWERECAGVTINGVTRVGGHGTQQLARTCNTHTIADNTELLSTNISPDITLAPSPFGKVTNLSVQPSRKQYGKIMTGNQISDHVMGGNMVDIHMTHPH